MCDINNLSFWTHGIHFEHGLIMIMIFVYTKVAQPQLLVTFITIIYL